MEVCRVVALFGETPEAPCYGYIELDQEGTLLALYNSDGEEIDRQGGHEYVREAGQKPLKLKAVPFV